MPFVSVLEGLKNARAGGYAIPCFNVFEGLAADGVIAAAQEKRSPVITAVYDFFVDKPNAPGLVAFVRTQAERAGVPVSMIVDHGGSFEVCVRALRLGFTDVMFDGSRLPLEENIAATKAVVRLAHAAGAACEGDLGHVGSGSEYATFGALGKGFSDPAEVERFVAETGVDSLAIAIGTAHGEYNAPPRLDLDRLAEIRRRVPVPLVLHGGSGLPEELFRAAVAGGIGKINVFTDLGITCARRVAAAVAAKEKPSYFDIIGELRESFRERCGYFMDLFGSSGKA